MSYKPMYILQRKVGMIRYREDAKKDGRVQCEKGEKRCLLGPAPGRDFADETKR
jgi:hypothetical protein